MNISRLDTFIVVGFLILVQGTGAVAGFWLPAIAPEVADDVGSVSYTHLRAHETQ